MFWLLGVILLLGLAIMVYGDVRNRFRVTVFGAILVVAVWIPLLLHTY